MIVWFVILLSLAAAFLGLKKGFLFMFATLFTMMFAIFIAVLSTPMMLSMSPGLETSGYYAGGCMLVIFLLIFLVLEGFGWFFFLRDREDYFPKLLEKIGGATVGFFCGYGLACTLLLGLCIMPCSRGQIDWLCTRDNLQKISTPGVFRICNFLGWYSLECFDGNVERAVGQLLGLNDPKQEEVVPVLLPRTFTNPGSPAAPSEPPSPAVDKPAEPVPAPAKPQQETTAISTAPEK
ncbi:MAG: CvpA family protein [Planctomycetaceae bacterium]|nr:CvpA family protein [Planctomycetaceae bacterium]